jgi:hypothetical protein
VRHWLKIDDRSLLSIAAALGVVPGPFDRQEHNNRPQARPEGETMSRREKSFDALLDPTFVLTAARAASGV